MLFNSLDFSIFFPIFFVLYWFVFQKNLKLQNLFIVIASYVFYGWWDWRFLNLIAFTSLCSFISGITIKQIRSIPHHKDYAKWIMIVNIIVNLLVLCYYKYFNFFIDSFISTFKLFGYEFEYSGLSIILPVGISFYTFQALSYTIDVYRKDIAPTENIINFFAYVSFFPQLVAGPIERATNLLPQFSNKRVFDYATAVEGSRQILWGLILKMIVADNCAPIVDSIFNNYQVHTGSTLLLGAIYFTFQIYGDFAGYSYIAIGISKLLGFRLITNFNYPYFSRDIAEFWRRWHISLSRWFRDYIYIPLGGSKNGKWITLRNTLIIFIVSGLWHGANWTFLLWGLYHGLLFTLLLLTNKNRKNIDIVARGSLFPSVSELLRICLTFFTVVIGWVIFRAENIYHAFGYIRGIFSPSLFTIPKSKNIEVIIFILIILIVEWCNRSRSFGLCRISSHSCVRWIVYVLIIVALLTYAGQRETFIYFQF